jgi:NAD(P)-dependent dehydrogenase (short-subunit alcohol dehydrogenase family)
MTKPICAVVGVGPGNGAALARRYAREGYTVALLARSAETTAGLASELGEAARAYTCDAADPASVQAAFAQIRADLGDVDVLIYNPGGGVRGSVEDVSVQDFEAAWRVNALGCLVAAQQVIPAMKRKGQGGLIIIGATASRRGMPQTAAFAPAKMAQRALAESMARHLWPAGIHVALIIIDGVVDLPRTRQQLPDKPDSFFVQPDDVAETAYWLSQQPRSAWAFEVEARPFGERW